MREKDLYEESQYLIFKENLKQHKEMTNKAIASYVFNVSKDTVEDAHAETFAVEKATKGIETCSGIIQKTAEYVKGEEERNDYLKLLSIENMKKSIAQGKTEFQNTSTFDFGRGNETISIHLKLMHHPETRELFALTFGENITGSETAKIIIEQLVKKEYNLLAVIDMKNDKYTRYEDLIEGTLSGNSEMIDNYSKVRESYIKRAVVKEEQERVRAESASEKILRELEKAPEYTIQYNGIIDGKPCIMYSKYTYIDKSAKKVLLQKMNVTDIFEAKEEETKQSRASWEKLNMKNKVRENYFSNISNEIKTPLNIVAQVTDAAMSIKDHNKVERNAIAKVRSSIKYMNALLDNMEAIAGNNTEKYTITEKYFKAEDLIKEALIINDDLLKERRVTVETIKSRDLAQSYIGDAAKIQQILVYIIANAIKFSEPAGNVLVGVKEKARELKYTIEDTGCGISEELLPEIFHPFVKGEKDGVGINTGEGMDLAVCDKLIKMLHGRIEVKSKQDKGAVFTILIPIKSNVVGEKAPETEEKKNFMGKKILVVEDHKLNVEIVRRVLSREGIEIEVAVNGKVAVEKFLKAKENYYDGILMDIRMPEMNGIEAAKEIRDSKKKDAATIPIIAMTATAFAEDIENTQNAGMNAHLAKPVNPKQLFEVLEKLLK